MEIVVLGKGVGCLNPAQTFQAKMHALPGLLEGGGRSQTCLKIQCPGARAYLPAEGLLLWGRVVSSQPQSSGTHVCTHIGLAKGCCWSQTSQRSGRPSAQDYRAGRPDKVQGRKSFPKPARGLGAQVHTLTRPAEGVLQWVGMVPNQPEVWAPRSAHLLRR